MPARPTNSDLQRQIYAVQQSVGEVKASVKDMNGKLDRALEHSAAHKARLDNHDSQIKAQAGEIATERAAREGMGWWMVGVFITALLGLATAAMGVLTGNK